MFHFNYEMDSFLLLEFMARLCKIVKLLYLISGFSYNSCYVTVLHFFARIFSFLSNMRKISVVRHSVLNIITQMVTELKRDYLHYGVRKEPESQLFLDLI